MESVKNNGVESLLFESTYDKYLFLICYEKLLSLSDAGDYGGHRVCSMLVLEVTVVKKALRLTRTS